MRNFGKFWGNVIINNELEYGSRHIEIPRWSQQMSHEKKRLPWLGQGFTGDEIENPVI